MNHTSRKIHSCTYDCDLYDYNMEDDKIVKVYRRHAIQNHVLGHFSQFNSLQKMSKSMFMISVEEVVDLFITHRTSLKYKRHANLENRYWVRLDLDVIGIRPKTIAQPGLKYSKDINMKYILMLRKFTTNKDGDIEIITIFPRGHLRDI